MDSYEATKIVFSRIQALDPANASKITGYVLIQEHGEKEMIRLAFGPESLLHALILKAKSHLGISSNSSTAVPAASPSSPSTFGPISISIPRPTNTLAQHSPRTSSNNPSPLSVAIPPPQSFSAASSSWRLSSPSYAAVVNGPRNVAANGGDLFDDYNLQDHLMFLNETSSSPSSSSFRKLDSNMGFGYGGPNSPTPMPNWVESPNGENQTHPFHRRSLSLSDACFGSEDSGSGLGWKPCLYFARGFCKNGSSCKFLHGGFGDSGDSPTGVVGSPSKLGGFEEMMMRSKAMAAQQQQRLAAASQLMAGISTFPYNKCMNFLMNDTQRSAAALMLGEELQKMGRYRPERNDFSAMGVGGNVNPGSRQIYLTFPADSTFREEDVSNYFSIYGPVQDVRIPYQQKRMFGFVTFVYPDTVKLILAKGNPHFVCESRVLVKPYKEKGKVPEKKQQLQQHMERGDFSSCSSPTGIDSRDSYDHSYDLHHGTRMLYNTQDMLRRMEEQDGLQQAIELQGRRLMNLQVLDLKYHQNHHYHPNSPQYPDLGSPAPVASPNQPQAHATPTLALPSNGGICDEVPPEEYTGSPPASTSPAQQELNASSNHSDGNGSCDSEGEGSNVDDRERHESNLEHILPDNLFASPKKSAGDHVSTFSTALSDPDEIACTTLVSSSSSSDSNTLTPTASTLAMAAKNACSFHMPRFSSGHGAIEM